MLFGYWEYFGKTMLMFFKKLTVILCLIIDKGAKMTTKPTAKDKGMSIIEFINNFKLPEWAWIIVILIVLIRS
jgi:hypothetical protein